MHHVPCPNLLPVPFGPTFPKIFISQTSTQTAAPVPSVFQRWQGLARPGVVIGMLHLGDAIEKNGLWTFVEIYKTFVNLVKNISGTIAYTKKNPSK